ncbi:hypothetical protein OUZ56_031997 [Daphnia magna]|uniref:Uncharacterized protein n=1 Tax=Daphnia magna TaxID=35525 RepID=A0ABQ9ZVZ4_9CRUS|nr:hypothetical protein OUZ56_031997 [Daphnia magna]
MYKIPNPTKTRTEVYSCGTCKYMMASGGVIAVSRLIGCYRVWFGHMIEFVRLVLVRKQHLDRTEITCCVKVALSANYRD